MTKRHAATLAAWLICSWSLSARAGGGAATDSYDDVKEGPVSLSGLADVYLLYNTNDPASRTNQLRWSDIAADRASVNFARLTVAHRPGLFGARLDFGVGDTADAILAEDPATTQHHELARWLSYVEQAFVTLSLPDLHGLTLDVGKFNSPAGLEDNETPSNWNYSRSFLFTWAEPTLHTGARLTVEPVREKLAVTLVWINGWNSNVVDGNTLRSFGGEATWRPRKGTEITVAYIGGLERQPTQLADPALSFRNLLDGYVIQTISPSLSVAATADYGHDAAQGGVNWWGVAGYVQAHFRPWLTGALRAEYYADPDGFTTGIRQHLAEATATLDGSTSFDKAVLVARLEYRHDQSDARAFEGRSPRTLNHQDTVTLALVASY